MHRSDSPVVDLVHRLNALASRNWLQADDGLDIMRDAAFEEWLTKANQGIGLSTTNNSFFYVSKTLSVILGYPLELIYEKGPNFFQQVISPSDSALVENIIIKSEASLKALATMPPCVRVSFDYHIITGRGERKRIYQHTLPFAVVHEAKYYSLFILMDVTGFKSSPRLNYRVSYLAADDKFETIQEGTVIRPSPYKLTKREMTILTRLAAGVNMKQLADQLFVSMHTLKKHRRNILLKTGASNMVSLVREGLEQGWIEA